jgi:hypothetical protein
MAKLVLHVGPGKCGSTSIQSFFSAHSHPCAENMRFRLLDPLKILALRGENADDKAVAEFGAFLDQNLADCDVLVLSQEYLFSSPYALRRICALAKERAARTTIVGYSRRQSEFVVSAFSQWLFSSAERTRETTQVVEQIGIDPARFLGLERQLIACVANDFQSARQLSGYVLLDWNRGYRRIAELVDGMAVGIRCGALPKGGPAIGLIEDFCEQSGLRLRDEIKAAGWVVANAGFNPELVEAVNQAVARGIAMPAIDQLNRALQIRSAEMIERPVTSGLVSALTSYADCFYAESNRQLCRQYGLDENYFAPSAIVGKDAAMELIIRENEERATNPSAAVAKGRGLSCDILRLLAGSD